MSKYTTELRFICESYADCPHSVGLKDTLNIVIDKAREKIFDFSYPIYDESYKPILERKILMHFYLREIGFETVGIWKLYLNTKMNEIMPYYNELYKTTTLEFNPLYDTNLTRERKAKYTGDKTEMGESTNNDNMDNTNSSTLYDITTANTNGNTQSNQNINGTENGKSQNIENRENINKYSETPQGALDNLLNGTYLTNATQDTNNNTINNTIENTTTNETTLNTTNTEKTDSTKNQVSAQTGKETRNSTSNVSRSENYTNTDEYVITVSGKGGGDSYAKMLTDYRNSLINVDTLIINDLESLFMQLW